MTRSYHSLQCGALVLIGLLDAGCRCEDCNGFYLEAWIRVDANTLAGSPVPDVTIRADAVRSQQTWTDTTDADGQTVLHLFTKYFPDSLRVSAEPPPDYATPAPVSIVPLVGDTVVLLFALEPLTASPAASNKELEPSGACGRSAGTADGVVAAEKEELRLCGGQRLARGSIPSR